MNRPLQSILETKGISRVLKKKSPDTKIIVCEPDNAQLLGSGIAQSAPAGSNILCMLPDTGERYLSTPLFDDIVVEMSEEEWEVSRSTPNYRFDAATTWKKTGMTDKNDETPTILDEQALAFVKQVTSDADNLGGKIRAVLLDQLGSPTIPQIYISGQHIGGATDIFTLYSNGSLKGLLAAQVIRFKEMPKGFEPLSLLPGWLHKR